MGGSGLVWTEVIVSHKSACIYVSVNGFEWVARVEIWASKNIVTTGKFIDMYLRIANMWLIFLVLI